MEPTIIDVSVGLAAVVIILKIVFDFIVKFLASREAKSAKGDDDHHPVTLADINRKLTTLLTDIGILKTKFEASSNHSLVVDRKLEAFDERTRTLEAKVAALEVRHD